MPKKRPTATEELAAVPQKKPSGAQNRKRQRAEAEESRRTDRARREANPEGFAPLETPPNDAVARIAWANKAAAQVLHEVMSDTLLSAKDRWKLALEAARSLGMTSSKAVNEERLQRIEEKIYGKRTDDGDDGLDELEPINGQGQGRAEETKPRS